MTQRTTRAQRLATPLAREVVRELAVTNGGCLRPVQLRRTDTQTGQVEQVLVPRGHARMGHSSTRAALIYLHSTTGRQPTLADTLGAFIEVERTVDQAASGTDVARRGQADAEMTDSWSTDLG